jgi:hypothetical protein
MALNPQFPNYANGPAGTEVIAWTVVGGQPLYRLPVAYVNTGFGAAFVCEGSTVEAPTYPEGVYSPDPNIESAGVISGDPEVGNTLTFAPGVISGTAPITATYNWIRYIPGGQSVIVGSGLSYVVQVADITHPLVVQTVAAGPTQTVATQTVPFGPCYSSSPIITDPGTISIQGSAAPGYCPLPGDVLEYSGPTILFSGTYTTYTTWVNSANPDEVWQVGGSTFTIPDAAVGDSVIVKVVVFGVGAPNSAQDETNAIAVCGYLNVVVPSKISERFPLFVGQGLTGEPAVFDSYGTPTVTFRFYDVTDPLNPIALTPPNTTYYIVKTADYGKSIAFITDASIGILTARSSSSTLGPVDGYLNIITDPVVSYTADIVVPGTVLTGTAGVFEGAPPVTSVTNRFYRNDGTPSVPNWVVIGSAPTYVVTAAEVGKDVAYGSSAVSTLYPSGVLALSNPVRPVYSFEFLTTGGYTNVTRPGQPPIVGDTIQQVYPTSFPQNDKHSGTVPLVGIMTFAAADGTTNTSQLASFTIPDSFYRRTFYQVFTATYEGRTYRQTTGSVVIGGTKPTIATPGTVTSDNPSIPFTPGTNAIFTKPVITPGAPVAFSENWTWYLRDIGGTETAIQNGGTSLLIPISFSGKTIEVRYTVANAVGSTVVTYTAPVPVPPPTLVFTSIGQLSGGKVFAADNTLPLSFTNSTATDGTSDPITITKSLWVIDSLGNKFYPARSTSTGAQTLTVVNTFGTNQESMAAPPGDPAQIPFPCINRFLAFEWIAVNPKTGGRATVVSTPFGGLTQAGNPYGGTTPPSIVISRPDNANCACVITAPTFNNGGYLDVATVKVTTIPSIGPSYVVSTGTLTFTVPNAVIDSYTTYIEGTIRGPAGNSGWFAYITR